MRNVLLITLLSVSSLSAQQTPGRSSTVVSHPFNPADSGVSLLGEDTAPRTLNGLRLRDGTAPACITDPSHFVGGSRLPLGATEIGTGSIPLPSGWTARAFAPLKDQPSGQWSRLAAIFDAPPTSLGRAAQVFIFYGSDEGYPNVRLLKDSKVVAVDECTSTLVSSQPVSIIRASVVSPDRSALTYVVGYAKVSAALWVSFLGSSSNALDKGVMVEMVKSLAVTGVK